MKKLCVCGRSKTFPICDGNHLAEGWNCARTFEHSPLGFCATPRYENLARKLASHYQALLCHGPGDYAVDHLICIVDGSSFGSSAQLQKDIVAEKTTLFSLGVDAGCFARPLRSDHPTTWQHSDPQRAFLDIRQFIEAKDDRTSHGPRVPKPCFVSHAVADEAWLLPITEYLKKHFFLELFLCASSIPVGSDWHQEIMTALSSSEQFVFVMTEHSIRSQFCSFEIGAAMARNKDIAVIATDGAPAPAFLQHIQHIDVARIQRQKPWLEREDVVTEQLIEICHYPRS